MLPGFLDPKARNRTLPAYGFRNPSFRRRLQADAERAELARKLEKAPLIASPQQGHDALATVFRNNPPF